MKKIWSMLLILIVSISGLFTATAFAEELPIIPSNSKTTITIEKSESIQKPLGTMKLKTSQAELDFVIHQKEYRISEYFFLEDEYGNHGQLDSNNLLFSSSDTSIFTVEDGRLYTKKVGSAFLNVTYHNQSLQVPIHILEYEVLFEFENGHDATSTLTSSVSFQREDGSYHSYSFAPLIDLKTGALQVMGIDWSIKGPYTAVVVMGDHVYNVKFDQSDKGGVVKIPYNASDFTKVTFDIPTTDFVENVGLSLKKHGVETNNSVHLGRKSTLYIMNGEYNFKYDASSPSNYYMSFTDTVMLTGDDRTFSMPLSQFSKFDVQLDFQKQATVKTPLICKPEIIGSCLGIGSSQPLYLKHDQYSRAEVPVVVDSYQYQFDLGLLKIPSKIMIDDQLTTEIKFANQTYEGDSFVSFGTSQEDESYLRIVNGMGHRVIGIRDSSYKNYAGKLVFTRGAERYEAPVSGGNDRYYVELPNVSGTFDVTYTFAEDEQIPERPRPDVSGKWEDWLNTKDTVPNNYTWTINLSSAPMSTTVNTNNVFVVDEQGYLVEGVQVKVEGTRILVSAPMSGYEAGKAYQLYIRDSVKNGEGKKLVNTKMSFNVK